MGSKPGVIVRFMCMFANATTRQVESNVLLTSAVFFCGYAYGGWKGGHLRDLETQTKIKLEKRDYERQEQLYTVRKMAYEAKARKVTRKATQFILEGRHEGI